MWLQEENENLSCDTQQKQFQVCVTWKCILYKVVDEANLSSELELASVLISFAGRWHKLCWFAACFNKRQFCRFFLFSFCYICNKDVQTCSTWYNLQYFMFFLLVFHSQYASGCLAENFLRRKKNSLVWAIVQTNIWSWSSTIAIAVDTDATAILMYPLITLYHYRIVQYHTFYHYLICFINPREDPRILVAGTSVRSTTGHSQLPNDYE